MSADVRAEPLAYYQSERPLSQAEAGWLALAMVPPGDDPTGWGPVGLRQMNQEAAK